MEENKNDLIILEQLPIIKYHLEQLSVEIKEKVDRANSLVVNEDTVKDVKNVRAELNKEFKELEEQRKTIKNAIMQKYDEFNDVYTKNVSDLYKQADSDLKDKIDTVENQLKKEKEDELREFVKQHCEANNVDIPFERIGLNITLSASLKSLKEQALEFIDKVVSDMKLIEMEEYKDEILLEYIPSLDFAKAKLKVSERHRLLEEIKKQQEIKQEQEKQEEKVIEKVEETIEIPEEIIEIQFTIKTTKNKAKKVKEFLLAEGIEYE